MPSIQNPWILFLGVTQFSLRMSIKKLVISFEPLAMGVCTTQEHEEQFGATVDGSYPPSPCYRPPDR